MGESALLDRFEQHLVQLMINAFGEAASSAVQIQHHTLDGSDLWRVHAPASGFPVDAEVFSEAGQKAETDRLLRPHR